MAIVGVSKPYYAKYNYEDGVVSYADGGIMGKMVSVDIELEISEDNNLYGDNGVAETDRVFSGGTVTVSTTDLSQAVSRDILGVREEDLEDIPGVTDKGVKELIFDDSQATPYLGCGAVIKEIVNGITKWRGVILNKVMFSVPSISATTQGDSIEWQTPELEGTIMRDDSEKHPWMQDAYFTSESQAEAYIKHRLNITATQTARMFSRAGLNIQNREV